MLSRNDVLSRKFSGAETKRSLGEPRQDCRAAGESLAPLNQPGSGSKLDGHPLFQPAMHYSLHGRRKRVLRKSLPLLSGWSETIERPLVCELTSPFTDSNRSECAPTYSYFTIKSLTLPFGQTMYS